MNDTSVPDGMAKVQIFAERGVTATVDGVLKHLPLDAEAIIPRAEFEIMKTRRHAVEIR